MTKAMENVIDENRLTQLKELLKVLANEIDQKPGARDLAQLAKQYRETLKEIEEIEGSGEQDDEISKILSDSDGMPGAVRKSRA